MRYVGRHRAPRPLYLRMPVMVGIAAALLIGGPALAATTGLLSDSGAGHGLATGPLLNPTTAGSPEGTTPAAVTPSLIAPTTGPTAAPFTAIQVRAVRTTTSSTSSQPIRTTTTTSSGGAAPPRHQRRSSTTTTTTTTSPPPTDSPTTTPTPTDSPTTTPTPTGSG